MAEIDFEDLLNRHHDTDTQDIMAKLMKAEMGTTPIRPKASFKPAVSRAVTATPKAAVVAEKSPKPPVEMPSNTDQKERDKAEQERLAEVKKKETERIQSLAKKESSRQPMYAGPMVVRSTTSLERKKEGGEKGKKGEDKKEGELEKKGSEGEKSVSEEILKVVPVSRMSGSVTSESGLNSFAEAEDVKKKLRKPKNSTSQVKPENSDDEGGTPSKRLMHLRSEWSDSAEMPKPKTRYMIKLNMRFNKKNRKKLLKNMKNSEFFDAFSVFYFFQPFFVSGQPHDLTKSGLTSLIVEKPYCTHFYFYDSSALEPSSFQQQLPSSVVHIARALQQQDQTGVKPARSRPAEDKMLNMVMSLCGDDAQLLERVKLIVLIEGGGRCLTSVMESLLYIDVDISKLCFIILRTDEANDLSLALNTAKLLHGSSLKRPLVSDGFMRLASLVSDISSCRVATLDVWKLRLTLKEGGSVTYLNEDGSQKTSEEVPEIECYFTTNFTIGLLAHITLGKNRNKKMNARSFKCMSHTFKTRAARRAAPNLADLLHYAERVQKKKHNKRELIFCNDYDKLRDTDRDLFEYFQLNLATPKLDIPALKRTKTMSFYNSPFFNGQKVCWEEYVEKGKSGVTRGSLASLAPQQIDDQVIELTSLLTTKLKDTTPIAQAPGPFKLKFRDDIDPLTRIHLQTDDEPFYVNLPDTLTVKFAYTINTVQGKHS